MLGSCGFMDIRDHTVFQQSQGQRTLSLWNPQKCLYIFVITNNITCVSWVSFIESASILLLYDQKQYILAQQQSAVRATEHCVCGERKHEIKWNKIPSTSRIMMCQYHCGCYTWSHVASHHFSVSSVNSISGKNTHYKIWLINNNRKNKRRKKSAKK